MLISSFSKNKRSVIPLQARTRREIQITPFVDVVLVLLVILMITSPLGISGLEINLPNGSEKVTVPESDNDFITITMNQAGTIYLNENIVKPGSLVSSVRSKTNGSKDKKIFIRGDKSLAYGQIMSTVDILNHAGYRETVLVTTDSRS